MLNKKSGLLIVLLAVVLALAACSGGGSGSSGESTTPAPGAENNATTTPEAGGEGGNADGPAAGTVYKFPEKKQFTMLTNSHATWPYNPDWLIWKLIEEQTNATFKVEVPAGTIQESLSLTIATGELPDIMFMTNYAMANQYGAQGALANILDYIDLMPNFKAWMEQYPDATQMAMSADGKMYIFPNEGFGETNRMIWIYRDDIFKQLNLQQPKTWDELHEVLKALKQAYPDSYPLVFRSGLGKLTNMGAAFGTGSKAYYDFDEKAWVYSPIEPEFRTMLEYLNRFYKDGLIPPDFLTMGTAGWQEMVSTDKAFVTLDYIGRIDFFNVPMREKNPGFTMAHMPPPAGPGGKQEAASVHFIQTGMSIASNSKQLEDVMRFMDFMYTEKGRELGSWGQEGVTYTVENGKKVMSKDYKDVSDLRLKTGLATDGTYTWIDYDAHLALSSPDLQAAYPESRKYDAEMQPLPAFNDAETEVSITVGDALNKYADENTIKFIFGDRSFDQWDAYVAEIENLGVESYLQIYRDAYERSLQQ